MDKNELQGKSSRLSSNDFEYIEDDFKYINTYLGVEQFSGEEALWKNDIPLWSMNYTGRILDETFSGKFLKEVLSLVSKDNPYRGPIMYEKGQYKYHCIINGEFEWFQRYEEIYFSIMMDFLKVFVHQ